MKSNFYCVIFFFVTFIFYCTSYASSNVEDDNISSHQKKAVAVEKYENSMALIREALAFLEEKKYEQAIKNLLLAKEIVPVPLCSYVLGLTYYVEDDYEKALFHLNEALMLYSSWEWETNEDVLEIINLHKKMIAEKASSSSNHRTISSEIVDNLEMSPGSTP